MIWTWWMTLLVIFAVLFLIGCIPVGGDVRYDENGVVIKAKAGPIRIQILPKGDKPNKKKAKKTKPKKAKPKKEKPKKGKSKKEQTPAAEGEKKKSPLLANGIDSVFELLEIATDTLGNLRRKLRLEELQLYVTFDGGDPAKAAINYGRAWAVLGGLTPYFERIFVIKKRDIRPLFEYNNQKMQIKAHLVLTITIGRILALGLRAGVKFLKFMVNNKKAVQTNESSSC